jgi:hypothetical protein
MSDNQEEQVAKKSKRPNFISASDLNRIIEIISKCDKITPDEVVRKLNRMVEKGSLIIVPQMGVKK